MQLRLQLEIRSIKGPIVAWVPPPPGDRLWFSFVTPPELIADAQPQVSLRYSARLAFVFIGVSSPLLDAVCAGFPTVMKAFKPNGIQQACWGVHGCHQGLQTAILHLRSTFLLCVCCQLWAHALPRLIRLCPGRL